MTLDIMLAKLKLFQPRISGLIAHVQNYCTETKDGIFLQNANSK